ncbi:MAG: cupredoxin family copper-binding protein, partial [Actinobacteria bacterium]|nr:cupredoxin family copper-binding protein [Actinomycetota bacterium]
AASSATVSVSNFKFAPVSLTVNVGDTVTWVNHDQTTHTATASSGAFDVNLPAGASGSFRFTQAGTFDYICKIHPFMKASVTVTGAGSSGGSGGSTSSSGGGSGSGSGGSAGSSGSGSNGGTNPLPHTGVEVASMLVTGLALLGLGLTVRRGIRRPGRPPG